MAEKYFNREQAEELLPMIGDCLHQARTQKQKIDVLDQELARTSARIMVLGGSLPPWKELAKTKSERDRFAERLQEAINKILEAGCLVKDLDEGLVDFPSLREGREVYLCWKLGEERIQFWHGIDEGFAGRKPLAETTPDETPPSPPRVQ